MRWPTPDPPAKWVRPCNTYSSVACIHAATVPLAADEGDVYKIDMIRAVGAPVDVMIGPF